MTLQFYYIIRIQSQQICRRFKARENMICQYQRSIFASEILTKLLSAQQKVKNKQINKSAQLWHWEAIAN